MHKYKPLPRERRCRKLHPHNVIKSGMTHVEEQNTRLHDAVNENMHLVYTRCHMPDCANYSVNLNHPFLAVVYQKDSTAATAVDPRIHASLYG